MKIALLGYGKMGHEIENIVREKEDRIHVIIDNENDWLHKADVLKACDVAIEFSTPDTVLSNIKNCLDMGVPVVVGTTGWHHKIEEIKEYCKKCNGALLYASNFSIGVNIIFEINRKLAEMLEIYTDYTPKITEIHHTQKLDAPSGTAITLAQDIIKSNKRIKNYNISGAEKASLYIESVREGNVPGTHSVEWDSPIDKLSLRHEAKNRKGFAMGALLASKWLQGKKGFYSISDMLK